MPSGLPTGMFPHRPLINWLPDETVYSLASRFHQLSGNTRAEQTARQLFGHAHGGYPHDLPSGLQHLADVFEGSLGTVAEIARARTILPFLLLFRDALQRKQALSAVAGAQIGNLKLQLGLPASRFGAHGALKACRSCIEADRHEHGAAYWHRDHQLPGVWICAIHKTSLAFSKSSRAGVDRFGWVLPRAEDLTPGIDFNASGSQDAHAALSSLVSDSARYDRELDGQRVCEAILARLQERDLARLDGRLRTEQVSEQFAEVVELLRSAPDISSLSRSPVALLSHVHRFLRRPSSGHSLSHCLVIHWLFKDWSDVVARCESNRLEAAAEIEASTQATAQDPPARRLVYELVAERGLSITAAANRVGISVVTAQVWMATEGYRTSRRPSKLDASTLKRLIADLAKGTDIDSAASRAGVSVTSANRVLRTEVGLYDRRRKAIDASRKAASRRAWNAALAGGVSTKLAREIAPAEYAWLYRNDRDWLKQENLLQRKARPRGPRLNWDARDLAYLGEVQTAALRLFEQGQRKIRLADLMRDVPELKSKLDVLERLPRTAKMLDMLVGRRGASTGKLLPNS